MLKNSLQSDFPEIAKEWDFEKNAPLLPDAVGHGSTKKVFWICKKGHSYEARVDHRTIMKSGCPYCAGKKPLAGLNDLATVYPDIASEWDYDRNEFPPEEYLPKSNKTVYWICPYCHLTYKKSVVSRIVNKVGCPHCAKEKGTSFQEQSFRYYLSKQTETISRYHEFGEEIDIFLPTMSIGIEYNGRYYHEKRKTHDVKKQDTIQSLGIRLIVIDEADYNHASENHITIKSTPKGRVDDRDLEWGIQRLFELIEMDCPAIDLKKDQVAIKEQYIVSRKKDNFAERFPEYAKEWDTDKNGTLKPENFTCGSNHKAFFDCPVCGTVYLRKIADRVRGMECPTCAGKRVKKGFNDLSTTHPDLITDWDERNDLKPDAVTAGSDKKVRCRCHVCQFEWAATISSRALGNVGCPACAGKVVISGYNDLETRYPAIAKEWHPGKNGITLPSQITPGSNRHVWWLCADCGNEWKTSVASRVRGRNCPVCGRVKAVNGRNNTYIKKHGSLAEHNPEIALQWDYERNEPLTPDNVPYASDKKVWWHCHKCDNHWQAVISSRTVSGKGCPECGKKKCVISAQQKRLKSRGSLADLYPDIAKQWDYERNAPLTPQDVTPGSQKKVGWICSQGHRWDAVIYSRKKAGCPICARQKKCLIE